MNETRKIAIFSLVFVFIMSWNVPLVWSQIRTGSISGTVQDATGAVLPGVEVTILNVDTGVIRVAITGDAGRYRAPELAVGDYEIRAQLAGFQTAVRRGIGLTIGREAVVDLTLEVGEITQEVVVTGEAALVNTTTSALGELVDEQQLHDLPLNARDLGQLALLGTGAVQARTAPSGSQFAGVAKVKISMSGARIHMTGYLLDGSDITDSSRGTGVAGAAGSLFGVETVREFQIVTNNFSAQYGRFVGGVISMVTKSGTNELHGSVFEFHRNDNLDATNFFTNFFNSEKPEFKRNQFGATIGGPIKENKTFFFGSYEGFRQSLGQTLSARVPTLAARQGILPGTTVTVAPEVQPFLDLYPEPTGADLGGGVAEFSVGKSEVTKDDFATVKIDHTFSDSDSFFGRYTFSDGERNIPHALPGTGWFSDTGNHYVTLEEKHIFSPNLINTLRVSFSRNRWSQQPPEDSPPLTIAVIPGQPLGQINVGGGITTLGLNIQGRNLTNAFSYADDVFITRSRHDLKVGVNVTRYQNNDFFDFRFGGVHTFRGLENFLTGRSVTWSGQLEGSSTLRGWRQTTFAVYVQDNIKLRPNFTLNLGLRYETTTTPTEVNDLMVNLRDPLNDSEGTFGSPFFKDPSKRNFAPRIGLAWDPFGDGKTSVRTAFGVFDDTILFYQYANQGRRQSPLSRSVTINNPTFPIPTIEGVAIRFGRTENVAEFEPHQPYMMQWNLSVQREVAAETTFTIAYVGSRGVNLGSDRNVNVAEPEILPDGRKFFAAGLPRRNTQFDDINYWDYGYSSFYHGLLLSGRRRFSGGLQFQASYTWGKSVDEGSRYNGGDYSGPTKQAQDPYDIKGSARGLSAHHVNHNFTFNYAYALPISGLSGFAQKIAEGWQINGILSLSTGAPVHISLGSLPSDWNRDRRRSGERPSVKPGRSNSPVLADGRDPNGYFDPTAFEVQPRGFYGNVARNTLISPGVATFDFSLIKNTSLAEEVNLQFRAEFFNIFNRANFGNPSTAVFSSATLDANGNVVSTTFLPTVGNIRSTRTTSREIQLGLRLVF